MPTPTQHLLLLLSHHSTSPWGSASIQANITLTFSDFILASRGCLNWPPPALPVIHLFLTGAGVSRLSSLCSASAIPLITLYLIHAIARNFFSFVIGVLSRFTARDVAFGNPPSYRCILFER